MTSPEDQGRHKASMARHELLMSCRRLMEHDTKCLVRIDLDIAKAFDPKAAEAIDKRLDRVKEISVIRKQMVTMDMPAIQLEPHISKTFSSEGYQRCDEDVAKWKDLKQVWEQRVALHIDGSDIRERMVKIFKTPSLEQGLPRNITNTAHKPPAGLPLRKMDTWLQKKRTASAEPESTQASKRQALTEKKPSVDVPQAEHSKFWAAGDDSNWAISIHSICMGAALYHVEVEHIAALQPDNKTKTVQVYRSQPQSYGANVCHSWVNVTRLHSALFLSPNAIRSMITANGSPKARIEMRGSDCGSDIVDITFFEPSGVDELLSKLKEVCDVHEEQVDSKQMNEMFANNRLRKKKVPL